MMVLIAVLNSRVTPMHWCVCRLLPQPQLLLAMPGCHKALGRLLGSQAPR